jgi:HK97 family phage prohead protease
MRSLSFRDEQLVRSAIDDVLGAPPRGKAGTMLKKHLDSAVKTIDDGRLTFIASAQILDRDSDVIVTSGIDLAQYRKNPVLLAYHDHKFPVGRVVELTKSSLDDGTPALLARAELMPAGVSARVDEVIGAVKFGSLAAVSIGFLPTRYDAKAVAPGQRGTTYHEISLLEISLVTVPSCVECVVTAKHAPGVRSGGAIPQALRAAFDDFYRRHPTHGRGGAR